ncbi:MAG: membrane protein insertion efficiency factor YidD [Candidatus Marisimplicoccus sp.]|jgi:putative membrane protein insertion efficiency factor|nr:membrane protein insertion efficiency factor YidD [Cryomorphaceae bacterium]MDC1034749.1 membrane protein insertion efficiency factor YidD [Flavobacteriaceae bacterium]MDG1247153.1 membrane protein insertion efficiency factor YidD [Flavobacteriaceae bacterium]RZO99847.1 MAG: membrane protein insertion efficiency factor YidD [Flavobacteriales bacterium]|tara:strand:+ start:800 stop:1030 length:231 start_codon:yes stop_codon:yes gene_type:complete
MIKISQLLALPFILLIKIYRLFISPLLGKNCIYTPSCSEYGIIALRKHGIFKGSFLTAKRILRCNSLFKGGYDPVP